MFLDKAFFTLNFKRKALKIALKNMTVICHHDRFRACTLECLLSEHVASPRVLKVELHAACPLFKAIFHDGCGTHEG